MIKEERKVHLIGNAHLDPVWLWRWQEGFAEIKATFRSALDRMQQFPEFIFTCAGCAYYKWVEEIAPEMFQEIKQRVREGRWVIVGGWWVQPDCNIPSGESFARHGLYSQRYFLEKFGTMARVGYNVDSFGHNAMLPQILKKSGMDFYLFMRPGEHEKKLPGSLFWWESGDGSRVMAFRIPFNYGTWWHGEGDPLEQKTLAVLKLAEEENKDLMNFYGVGNHGGGPTIKNLQTIRRIMESWGRDRVLISSPEIYFEEVSRQNIELPVVKEDLQHHASGCYSAHSEIKLLNRSAEHRLLAAEKFNAIASHILGLPRATEKLRQAWENVLFNQFHDIMGGCSIKEAYQDAEEFCGEALSTGAKVLNSSLQKISWSIDTMREGVTTLSKDKDWVVWEQDDLGAPLVVFNPLSWEVQVPVHASSRFSGVTDDKRNPLPIQTVRASRTNGYDKWDTLFLARIPAMGYRVFWTYKSREFVTAAAVGMLKAEAVETAVPAEIAVNTPAEPAVLENDFVRLEIEQHTGYIKRLYDKKNDVEVIEGYGAVPVVIDEENMDTWAHGIFEFRNEAGRFENAEVKVLESGPLRAVLRVKSRYGNSLLRQDFILYRHKPDIEVKVKLDWREKHRMLKLSFPVNVRNPRSVYEIPYGYIERPVNGEEEPGQQWLDVSGTLSSNENMEYGLALLNAGKYSFDVKENDMRMTVARGAVYADHYGTDYRDDFCEYMDQGVQEFTYALVPHAGNWKDAGIVRKAYELNVGCEQVPETYHKGPMPLSFEGIKISGDSIVATVFKIAEDGKGYVLRCYETSGRPCTAEIEIPMLKRRWTANFGKCEIKTFRIPEGPEGEVRECNLLELEC